VFDKEYRDAISNAIGYQGELLGRVAVIQGTIYGLLELKEKGDSENKFSIYFGEIKSNEDFNKIDEAVNSVRKAITSNPPLFEGHGFQEGHIDGYWNHVKSNWNALKTANPDSISKIDKNLLIKIKDDLNKLSIDLGWAIAPNRIRSNLKNKRNGESTDFDRLFNEIPDMNARTEILNMLKENSDFAKDCLIDVQKRLIYKAPDDIWDLIKSTAIIIAIWIIGLPIFWALPHIGNYFSIENWIYSGTTSAALVVIYLFVTTGSIMHALFDAIKQARSADKAYRPGIGDITRMIIINTVPLVMTVLVIYIVSFGYTAAFKNADWLTALALGYSADSISDTWMQGFDKLSASKISAIKNLDSKKS